ncbi:MAG TPA: universal stress protein [Vicinamibacterales bacterium]|nr:universal stress protein [Vicinamibacterales bacterium]
MPQSHGWRILVATDGSDGARRALEALPRLPLPDGTEVKVVTVVDTRSELPETIRAHRRGAEKALESARTTLDRAGYKASSSLLEGPPAKAILGEAEAWHATVIVLGARGLGRVRGLALGSVSSGVVRAAPCSVLLIKKELPALNVLAAVDASEHGPAAARKLAELRTKGTPVTVLGVIEPPYVKSLRLLPTAAANLVRAEIAAATRELDAAARAQLDELASVFKRTGWKVNVVVRAGVPVREIKAMAARSRATLVCIGARGTTGLERLLLGSVSEALLSTPGLSLFIGR